MKTTRIFGALALAVLAPVFTSLEQCQAATIVWTNTAGGDWSVAANWSGGALPTAADDVFITAPGTYTVTQDVHVTVASLTLGGSTGRQHLTNVAAVLVVNGTTSIQSSGVLGLNGGQMGGTAVVSVSGTLQWSAGTMLTPVSVKAGGLFDLVGSTDKVFYQSVTNHGTMRWSEPHNLYVAGAAIVNSSDGTFDVRNSQVIVWNGGAPQVVNAGLIRKSASPGTTTLSGVPLINIGTVEVQGGVLSHSGGSQFLDGSVFAGSGTNLLAGGAVLLHGAIQSQNLEVASGATIYGTNTLSGAARWTGGVMANTCDLTVANGSSLDVTGTAERRLDGFLRNRGVISWTGVNTFFVAYGAIDNQAGGTFDVRNDQAMLWAGGSPAFFNAGLLRKSAGAGLTTFDRVVLVNRGTVEVQTGILNHSQGSQFLDGSVLTGAGTNLLANGTMLFDGIIHSDNAELAGVTLIGTNTLVGMARWTGGVLGSICDLMVARGSILELMGTADRRLDGFLRNQGAITWIGSNTFYVAYGAIDNQAGGLFDVRNNQVMTWAGGTPLFLNAGLLRKSGGGGTSTMANVALINRGTVEVQTGILNHSQSSQFLDRSVLTGAGTNLLASGTMLFDGTIHSDNAELAAGILIGTNTLTGALRWTGGAIAGIGVMTVASNATLQITGPADRRLDGYLVNHGVIEWTGSNTFYFAYGAIDNQAGGLFDVRNNQAMTWAGGSPAFFNAGLLRKSASAGMTTVDRVVLVNRGTVEVQTGILNHSQGSQFLDGTVLTGEGTNLLASGTMLFDGTIHSDNAELAAGTLIGTNTLTGTLRWSGGLIGSIGVMTVASNATLQVTGTADRRLDGYLVNRGLIEWTGSNTFYLAYGAIDNQSGGIFDVRNDQRMAWAGGSPVFLNTGTFRKSSGPGFTDLSNVPFQNTGTVDVQKGVVRFLGGYTQTIGKLQFGLTSLTNFGQVQFAQPAPLTGTLAANLLGGFRPKAGDAFTVISYFPSYTGGFTAFELPSEAAWQTNSSIYGANAVTLTALNARPVMDSIPDKTINEQLPLTFTVAATDSDPDQTRSYALIDPPEGATINATSGLFSWTPVEAQGPSTNSAAVRVTDNGTPGLSATNTFTIVVNEVNLAPTLAAIPELTAIQNVMFLYTNSATDLDLPNNSLRFDLIEYPPGMTVDGATGVLRWTPSAGQVPGTNTITVRVTDNGVPSRADVKSFTLIAYPLPRLAIARSAGDAILMWPAYARGFGLKFATNFNPPIVWTDETNVVTLLGDRNVVTNRLETGERYFQLRHP